METEGELGGEGATYKGDNIGNTVRLIDVLRNATGANQITARSKEMKSMVGLLCRFQQAALSSSDELVTTVVRGQEIRVVQGKYGVRDLPEQGNVQPIKSQQASISRERERMIQGIQGQGVSGAEEGSAALNQVLNGFGEDDVDITPQNSAAESRNGRPSMNIQLVPSTLFVQAGRQVAESFTLNRRQSIALQLLCRHLDRVLLGERDAGQLCQFVGGAGGTGKSRLIEATVALFGIKGMPHCLLVTATSATAAATINGITIHSACNLLVDTPSAASNSGATRSGGPGRTNLRVDGEKRMDWGEKYMLIIDEVSMLGAKTLHAVNEQLCMFRGSTQDFGGIPVVLFLGDFRQFRPVQDRTASSQAASFFGTREKGSRSSRGTNMTKRMTSGKNHNGSDAGRAGPSRWRLTTAPTADADSRRGGGTKRRRPAEQLMLPRGQTHPVGVRDHSGDAT